MNNLRKYPESEAEYSLETKIDDTIATALTKYEELQSLFTNRYIMPTSYFEDIPILMNPIQITSLTDNLINIYGNDLDWRAGYFLSRIIQNSYDNNFNDFVINTHNTPLISLGHKLRGEEDNPLRLTINGDVANNLLSHSSHSSVIVYGDVNNCLLYDAKFSSAVIKGNIGDATLLTADNCILEAYGKIKHITNRVKNSRIILHDKDTYDKYKHLHNVDGNNVIYRK